MTVEQLEQEIAALDEQIDLLRGKRDRLQDARNLAVKTEQAQRLIEAHGLGDVVTLTPEAATLAYQGAQAVGGVA